MAWYCVWLTAYSVVLTQESGVLRRSERRRGGGEAEREGFRQVREHEHGYLPRTRGRTKCISCLRDLILCRLGVFALGDQSLNNLLFVGGSVRSSASDSPLINQHPVPTVLQGWLLQQKKRYNNAQYLVQVRQFRGRDAGVLVPGALCRDGEVFLHACSHSSGNIVRGGRDKYELPRLDGDEYRRANIFQYSKTNRPLRSG